MSILKKAHGRPREATANEKEILHTHIQKGLARWRPEVRNSRVLRELFELNGNFVILLPDIRDDDDAEACVVKSTIWMANNRKYYGELVAARIASRYLQTDDEDADAEAEEGV